MSKVSIIIPARGEKRENLERTIQSIEDSAIGEYEIIIGFNGQVDKYLLATLEDHKVVVFPENIGIKGNINTLALLATGKYLLKLDAHCAVSKGFDEVLKADMEEDWVVTPRFKIIKDDWTIQMRDGEEEFYDYFYLSCPFTDKRGLRFKAGGHWGEKTKENYYLPVDSTPQIHGSCWFMTKDRFFELGGFPLVDPYGHGQEPLWIALKNWVEGGMVVVNKNVWYAHLHQDSKDRGYPEDKAATEKTYNITAEYWLKHPKFETFIERFMPMPTWPENWKELLKEWRQKNG